MTRVTVHVFHSRLEARTAVKGWRVDDHLAVVKWHGYWQVAHIQTGLITNWTRRLFLVQAIQFAQAATRRFGKRVLAMRDPDLLVEALRAAGSDNWARRRFRQIQRKPSA